MVRTKMFDWDLAHPGTLRRTGDGGCAPSIAEAIETANRVKRGRDLVTVIEDIYQRDGESDAEFTARLRRILA